MITRLHNAFHHALIGWKKQPPVHGRSWTPSWLPPEITIGCEADAHPHSPEEKAELFLSHNTGSTEIETLNWLHATICLLKPACLLETGALDGLGTIAMASACRDNGLGRVHSVEIDPHACERLARRLRRHGLAEFVEIHCSDSLQFLRETDLSFDLGFFDSLSDIRAEEFRIISERGKFRGVAAFHDTSPHRTKILLTEPTPEVQAEYRARLQQLARLAQHSGSFETHLSRGLFVIFPQPGSPTNL